ncbi:FAD-dependent oxidoreductase [uncultured Devosia sp.]|uniref:FAD-dependent oxidoreductase n=1 Tax=uncultured Devosia sp. TaxID=211434 RepID=UPI002612F652|nr:FAD-dependent oxidoreductase [uncultured Devosia sp.]
MAELIRPELCIVGAGALGIALAQYARRLGAQVTLVDRGHPEPGDGPQRAMRVAALMASAARAASIRNAGRFGLNGAEPKVTMKLVQERAVRLAAERAVLDSGERLTALGITVLPGPAQFVDAATLAVGDVQVRPQAFILAVGGEPIIPAVPGLDAVDYFTADSILENARKLTHLLVIGSDAEGLALAQAFARLGSEVTLVPQGDVLAGFDIEASSILIEALQEDGVRLLDGGVVDAIQARSQGIGATVALPQGDRQSLDVSHVLICAGAQVNAGALALDAGRVRPVRGQAGRFALGSLGQSSNRRVRFVGAGAGIEQWQHALSHGRAVVESVVLGAPGHRPSAQPRLVQTAPALAQIGRWPADVKRLAKGHAIVRAGAAENDKARALGIEQGLTKLLVNPKGQVIAASLAGPDAGELAGVLALAMDRGIPLQALADLSLPHPSLLATLCLLGENHKGAQTVSSWQKLLGAVRRRLTI